MNGTISYTNEAGKIYQLGSPIPLCWYAVCAGLHLPEKHVTWRPMGPSPAACSILRSISSS
ncbi:hypothetical protein MJK72_02035 [Klebsiella pneumoniae]|nr:hypothetical protein MJK72_02035 [Klebsiella pneumoniae]